MTDLNFLKLFVDMHTSNSKVLKHSQRINKINKRLNEIINEFEKMESEKEALEKKIKNLKNEQYLFEKNVSEFESKISACQNVLLKLKTTREVEAKQKEIDHLNEQKNLEEDKILDAMENIENSSLELEELTKYNKEKLSVLRGEATTFKEKLNNEKEMLQTDEERLKELLKNLESYPKELNTYWDMEKRFKDTTMVKVYKNSCDGCHQTLSPQVLQIVRKGVQLITCNHCGRYLFE
jgi:predicted  nucleic acid-binding Zn-ribbon protein